MRLPSENMPTVGLGLNNFIVKADIVKVVEVLRRRLSPMAIVIRRHPNSQKSLNLEIESDPMEPLVDFLSRCDLLVAGNSGIQLQALCFGVPVIHCGQLDRHPFDAYGLVSRGIVYGVMDADSISMDEVKSFYSSPKWRGVDFPPHDINAAEVLADWLCSCGIH
jgi:hypothetical protein